MAVNRTAALVLAAILPGSGLVCLGWVWTGLAVGVSFAAGANALILERQVAPGTLPAWGAWAAAAAAAGAWVVSVGLTGFVAARRMPAHTRAARDALFAQGAAAYLRSDFEAAERAFAGIVRLWRGDVEAHLRLAMLYKEQGLVKQATAELRRSRFYDVNQTWRWEVGRERAALARREESE